MSLSPQVLLSSIARERCIAKLKELPIIFNLKTKQSAAVLVPICVDKGKVCLLYTLRSSKLKNHSGQVSFPGGKMDENETIFDTALRETEEEIGIPKADIDVWSEMPKVIGRNKEVLISPVVGLVKNFDVNKLKPNLDEVEEIFTIPMEVFCDPTNHAHNLYEKNILPIFFNEKHTIWGITGLITHFFLQCFLPENEYKVDFLRKKLTFAELMPAKL
ncbi:nucleoside diphosphate-linked moiety X motif 8-like [Ostrinia furnacalis]|uniref:nucleoside diphosphate-linked moiety X motif 8-like n=1 Tax=Ostrinia furnacalis TaxID=93504 RepID=UPI00103DE6B4|nr:nucleoside diphosphate-linked moiety X motif 8-like [Ostrinia furnacalis]